MTQGAPRTVQQAAEELNVSVYTIRAWIAKRRLGYTRINGRAIRVPQSEIVRLLEEGKVPPLRRPAA